MTRRRRLVWATAIVLLAVVVFGVASALSPTQADSITQASCDQIKPGMTESQVEAIFGRPADRQTILTIPLEEPGKPVARQKNWSGRGHGIAVVAFGPDGGAVWANFVYMSDESWFAGLVRRTGLDRFF